MGKLPCPLTIRYIDSCSHSFVRASVHDWNQFAQECRSRHFQNSKTLLRVNEISRYMPKDGLAVIRLRGTFCTEMKLFSYTKNSCLSPSRFLVHSWSIFDWLVIDTMFINFSFRFNVLFFILYLLPVILYSLLCTIIVTFHIFFTGDPSHLSRNCSWHFYAILGFSWLLLATPNLSCFHQRPPGSSGFLLIAIGSSENHDGSQRPVFFQSSWEKSDFPSV